MKKISMFVCCVLGSMGLATANISYANMQNNTSGSSVQPGNSGNAPQRNAQFEQAMSECANSVGKDANGGPDQSALTSCLQQKGYSKPENGGNNERMRGGNPPPVQNQQTQGQNQQQGQTLNY